MDITFGPTTCTSTTQDNQDGAFKNSLRKLATEKVQRDKPIRIKFRRRNIWEDSKVKLAKYTESDLNNMIRVQFVGELAVDQGGPCNEFFCLLHRYVVLKCLLAIKPANCLITTFSTWNEGTTLCMVSYVLLL